MKKHLILLVISLLIISSLSFAQDQVILVPKPVKNAPFVVEDSQDLFGKAWRFYRDGYTTWAADSLKKLIELSGFELKKNNYYIVVANFTPTETPIGMIHGDAHFHDTRLYGLNADSLYYIFISRDSNKQSYLSTVLTRKESYFEENLINFISLFPIFTGVKIQTESQYTTWLDVRKYEVPKSMQKNCDISVIVKKDFYDDKFLAKAVFDNTSLEKWSYGIATAVTSVNDVDFIIDGGTIVVRPKPKGDLATFGLINYHFKAVDTKAKTMATSFHLSGGLRISQTIEPILAIGAGVPLSFIDLHLFVGYSVEFAQTLESGYQIGDAVTSDVDPFKLKIRGKPRIGIEIKFP